MLFRWNSVRYRNAPLYLESHNAVQWAWSGLLVSAQVAIAFMNDVNTQLFVYLNVTLGGASVDNTTLVRKQMDTLTGEATARLKAIIVSAGTVN